MCPPAQRAGEIVLSTRVEQFLESDFMLRPPELLAGVESFPPALFPARATVGGGNCIAGNRHWDDVLSFRPCRE